MWFLSSSTNNGHPYNTNFIGIISNVWTDGIHNIPTIWRIDTTGEINDGYPYNYYMEIWLGEGGGGEEGEGDVIDTDTYGNNNRHGRNGTHNTLTSSPHDFDVSRSAASSTVLDSCNCYVMTPQAFAQAKKDITDEVKGVSGVLTDFLDNLHGTNIFDAIVSCKVYPLVITPLSATKNLFLYDNQIGSNLYQGCDYSTFIYDFGSVTLGISEEWHLTKCKYQIYLPFVGVMDFTPCNNDTLSLSCILDILQGAVTYVLKNDDGETLLIASGNIGINVPVNLSQAIISRNTRGNILGMVKGAYNTIYQSGQQMQSAVQNAVTGGGAKALGISKEGASAGRAGGAISSAGTDALNKVANTALDMITPKQENPMFQVLFGDDATVSCLSMTPRIIVHRAVPYNDAYCYNSYYGETHSKHYDTLSGMAGYYIKTINYKSNNITLTEIEKRDIENKMNAGVIL